MHAGEPSWRCSIPSSPPAAGRGACYWVHGTSSRSCLLLLLSLICGSGLDKKCTIFLRCMWRAGCEEQMCFGRYNTKCSWQASGEQVLNHVMTWYTFFSQHCGIHCRLFWLWFGFAWGFFVILVCIRDLLKCEMCVTKAGKQN